MKLRPPVVTITYPRCPACDARLDRDTLRRYGRRHDPDLGVDYNYAVCMRCSCKVRVFEVAEHSQPGKPGITDTGTMPA